MHANASMSAQRQDARDRAAERAERSRGRRRSAVWRQERFHADPKRKPDSTYPENALVAADDRIGTELDAGLDEHAEAVALPVDRLRRGQKADHMTFEVSLPAGLHMPIAAAHADAEKV